MKILGWRQLLVTAVCVSALALVGLSLAATATAVGPNPLRAELDAALEHGRESTGAPAATATVMRCGRLVWSGACGVMDLDSGRQATPHARFAIAKHHEAGRRGARVRPG